jgi:hypothetical protein
VSRVHWFNIFRKLGTRDSALITLRQGLVKVTVASQVVLPKAVLTKAYLAVPESSAGVSILNSMLRVSLPTPMAMQVSDDEKTQVGGEMVASIEQVACCEAWGTKNPVRSAGNDGHRHE